ncbi:MAG: nitrate reductase catalytic subunit [Planctomycetota bacterium]|nr:MAG: nitrate reductase catalytic subunit [Planctomycetota bacterium]
MTATRRDFMKYSAMAAVVSAARGTAMATPKEAGADPTAPDLQWHKSVCRFCGTGCGVMIGVRDEKIVKLRGDPEHPTTKGLVCAKALFLPVMVRSPDRLQYPQIRKNGKLERASWEEAMSLVAEKFTEAIKSKGPNGAAFYGSGQCLSEESYLANRLFKGGIGTNNVEGNPRLCMASAVGGYVSTFGKDEPMGSYGDIDHAKVFFLVGSNTAECHPVIFDKILARKQSRRDVLVIVCDPRKSPVTSIADVHLDPVPGYDLAIFHAMAHVIIKEGKYDKKFMDKNVQFKIVENGKPKNVGWDGYKAFLEQFTPEAASRISGVPADKIVEAARIFAGGPTMSFWTMGLNQRITGVWANNLMHNLHLITGQIGKPGATPFSLTGQPNACGGVRDTGSLCHILPYGRVVKKPEHRKQMEEIWGAQPGKIQPKPGLNTVELFKAMKRDEVQAILISTTNPGQSMPNLSITRDAMGKERAKKPFVCVIDGYPTRTTELADVVLPAAIWTEKAGVFGMSERRYQYQPKVCRSPGEARPDLEIILDLAARLEASGVVPRGYISSKFKNEDDVWDEMRLASKNTPYDFWGMTRERLKKERGIRWPAPTVDSKGTARRFVKGEDPLLDKGPFADNSLQDGETKFYAAPNHRAVVWCRPAKPPAEPVDDEYPVVMSTGRVLEHWHTGTMTMTVPQLRRAYPECYVEIHPNDARKWDIQSGDMVRITSRRGEALIKARVIDMPREGMVFVPWHWAGRDSLINFVTIDAYDPGSKQPEFKVCAVKIAKA